MAPDDDERGIDWLASQLGQDADDTADSIPPASDPTDAPAPTTRFGRRSRRAAEPAAEPAVDPIVAEPIAAPAPAAPPAPEPWWTTPLPQPVENDTDTAESDQTDQTGSAVTDSESATVDPAVESATVESATEPTGLPAAVEPAEPANEPAIDPAIELGIEPAIEPAIVPAGLPVEPTAVERVNPAMIEPEPVEPVELVELVEPVVPPVLPQASEPQASEPPALPPVTEPNDALATALLPNSDAQADAHTEADADAAADQPTELLPVAGESAEAVPTGTTGTTSTSRTEGRDSSTPSAAAGVAAEVEAPNRHRSRRVLPGQTQAALIWTAVGLLLVIVLVGLFYVGQRLVASPVPVAAPTASASPTPTPTPSPTPTPEVTAAQSAGVHEWNTLFGSECVEPYASPWEEDFTVVDCAAGHTAQLVYRGSFGGDATTVFPGEAALAAQINLLCTAPGILDLAAAGAYPNLQMQGSYPITEDQWTTGSRSYYCFVSRASGEPLTGSIMGAGPTA